MDHSPAYILAKYFIDEGLLSDPTGGSAWPVFVGTLPDGDEVADNAAACIDTTPVKDGRLMVGGNIFHFGCQVLLRSVEYNAGYSKIDALRNAIEAVDGDTVTIAGTTYQMDNITIATGIVVIGQEEKSSKRREMFSLNSLITLKEI